MNDAARVVVIGAGYVGATSAAVLAYLGARVTCIEREPARLEAWRSGIDPLCEPGLAELLRSVRVEFTADESEIERADVVVVAVGTPMSADGRPDLRQIDAAAAQIAAHARPGTVVLIRSTVPVGTCDRLQGGSLARQRVVSNPEFLREGHALEDAFFPDRVVAGGPDDARPAVAGLYRRIIEGLGLPGHDRAPAVPLCWMTATSAELTKYASNGFLATKLSFANEIANLAQAVGADATTILGCMGLDPRIGAQFLRPGLGWGGSCFPKDTRALQSIADGIGYDFLVLRAAIEQNTRQLRSFAAAIERAVPARGRIGLLGLAFKAGTADTRESPALALARLLLASGMRISAYDPAVRALASDADIAIRGTALEACRDVDAVAIATEWPEFGAIDLASLRAATRGDLLFDGRSLISPRAAAEAGFRYAGPSGVLPAAPDESRLVGTAA